MRATCKRITAEKEKDMPSSQYNHLSISFLNYYLVAFLAALAAFSRAFVSKIRFRKRIDSGVISNNSSSFKNSSDSVS